MPIRYAFDMGTNSIGWAVWRTGPDPEGVFGDNAPRDLMGAGVRLFKDGRNPKDGASLAEMRRGPRQSRKRRDRFVLRRADLLALLSQHGLMPLTVDERRQVAETDPYQLRAKGLDEALTLFEFGRVLFHLNQRRGFRSNRKTDKADKDKGKIAEATARLAAMLEEQKCRTFGEFLWNRHKGELGDPKRPRSPGRLPVRIRLDGQGAKALYQYYPTRELIRHEFDLLWAKQQELHPAELPESLRDAVANVIFRQRDLKPPVVGRCTFVPEEFRLPKALPSVQAREVYERLGHLRIMGSSGERALLPEQRDALASELLNKDKLTFGQIRKALKLGGDTTINFEEAGEKDLRGIATNRMLQKVDHYGPAWRALPVEKKDAFVQKLLDEADEEKLVARLRNEDGLSPEQAKACASIPLPEGYSRIGPTANAAILEALITERDEKGFVITYAEAVKRAGKKTGLAWHHSDERDGEIFDRLPYYGKILQRHVLPGTMDPDHKKDEAKFWGRITNPTVHIGLNQLRTVINDLIPAFGAPDEVVMELARELKQSAKEREKKQLENRKNREENEKRAKKLEELKIPDTGENRARLRLYEEQVQKGSGVVLCPFSGKSIGPTKLFSSEIEIEHLLPRSRTLDDSNANKVLCYREMNRIKRGKTPWEAFHDTPEWPAIWERAQGLPFYKRWRFEEGAIKRFMGDRDFLERQLNETKYLSRLAKVYVGKVCNPDKVYVTPGTLTGLLRGKWGLNGLLSDDNRKNRDDHRHHAVDAVVIGCMTRGLINRLARESERAERTEFDNILGDVPKPFAEFRDAVRTAIDPLIVSYKPEHGKKGALHEDTAYGLVTDEKEAAVIGNLIRRKPLADLTPGEVETIRDPELRKALKDATAEFLDGKGKVKDVNGFKAALAKFGAEKNIRRVRTGKTDASVVIVKDRRDGTPYKALTPGENHHLDVVQLRDGSWKGFAASVFEVNQKGWRPQWERDKIGGKLVMRLHKGDLVEVDDTDGVRRIKLVVRLEPSAGRVRLVPHNEGGKLDERHNDPDDSFRWDLASISGLKSRNCVAVRIDAVGRKQLMKSNA